MSLVTVPFPSFAPNTTISSAQVNSNNAALVAGFTTIDNTNVGAAGFFASQIFPLTTGNATFGGTLPYVFPNGLSTTAGGMTVPSGSTGGFLFTTATGLGVYAGNGAPAFSAPNGSMFLRYDNSITTVYVNTSGASSSGTTWSSVATAAANGPQLVRATTKVTGVSVITGTDTTMVNGFATAALGTSSGTGWHVFVEGFIQPPVNWNGYLSIVTTAGGTSGVGSFSGQNGTIAHALTNCVAQSLEVTGGSDQRVYYEADYANGATPTFSLSAFTAAAGPYTLAANLSIRAQQY